MVGTKSLKDNTDGSQNSAFGNFALSTNRANFNSIAIGTYAIIMRIVV